MDTNTIDLERIRLGISIALSNELPEVSKSIEAVEWHLIDKVVYSFRAAMWGQQKRVEIRHPRDWWQAFKARWFPSWALRRWPAQYTVHVITAQELFPKLVGGGELQSILRLEGRKYSETWDSNPAKTSDV